MKVISERFYNQGQSWNYDRVVELDNGTKLNAIIRRNAYDDQSFVKGFALDPVHLQWNPLIVAPISGAECKVVSYVQPEDKARKELFQKDADRIIEELIAIVG